MKRAPRLYTDWRRCSRERRRRTFGLLAVTALAALILWGLDLSGAFEFMRWREYGPW